MPYNNYFCELCDDYIEGYNLLGRFESNDGVKINNNYYCIGDCEKKARIKNYYLLNTYYLLKLVFFMIFLYFIITCL